MPVPDNNPIVVAPTPTPFRDDDSVDHDALARNIERWLKTPLSGFVLGTANGEELALSDAEKVDIVRTVRDAHGGDRFIVAGIDNPATAETIRLSETYAKNGADMIRVRIPRGLSPNQVESYFVDVTSRSPVPVVVIHQTFTGVPAAPPEVIGEVCSLDNVFGYITDHDIRFEGYVRAHVLAYRRFWICNGALLLYGALLGANGTCMWLGNVAPSLCMDIMRMGGEGRFVEAREKQAIATKLDRTINPYGTRGVKMALSLLGYEGDRCREPLLPVDDDGRNQIAKALEEAGLL